MHSTIWRSLGRLSSFAGLLLLAACNGNGYFNNGYYQHPGLCSYHDARLVLVSPAAGATGVPDAFPQLVIASSLPDFTSFNAIVLGTVGGVTQRIAFGTLIPASLPAGSVAPFPNATYYASSNPSVTFTSMTSVSVELNDESSPCTPGPSIGSFTVL